MTSTQPTNNRNVQNKGQKRNGGIISSSIASVRPTADVASRISGARSQGFYDMFTRTNNAAVIPPASVRVLAMGQLVGIAPPPSPPCSVNTAMSTFLSNINPIEMRANVGVYTSYMYRVPKLARPLFHFDLWF